MAPNAVATTVTNAVATMVTNAAIATTTNTATPMGTRFFSQFFEKMKKCG